jgi:membrane protein YdbS with pleckstrin-like domain
VTVPTLREPAHLVSPNAVRYWALGALIGALVLWVVLVVAYVVVPEGIKTWLGPVAIALLVLRLVHLVAMPTVRYRVHRWEVTPTAIYTRAGWLTREQRIAPLSRVQTVDSQQGPVMRMFRLSSITVTTASAAGPITIACLDQEVARQVVAELTEITGRSEGDAT